MLYRLLAVLSFLIIGATQAIAADCIIVGSESSYRIPDCIENSPTTAVQKFLGSNYAIITDRKDGKILAVFLAESEARQGRLAEQGENAQSQLSRNDSSMTSDTPDLQMPMQPPEEKRSIDFPNPISLSESDQTLTDLKLQGEVPAQFMVSFGDYQVLYALNEGDTIASVLEKERPNLLNLLDQQEQALLSQPSEYSDKGLQMVEQGRNALTSEDIVLRSVLVLK